MCAARVPVFSDDRRPFLRYYGINVFYSEKDHQKLNLNKSLARLIFFLGLCLIIISSIDISQLSKGIKNSEQSIWPSSGKGLSIGLYLICISIFTFLAVKEQTVGSFHILLIYVIIAIISCLFGLLTSIDVLDSYLKSPSKSEKANRTKEESVEFALSALFISIFTLAFLFLSCLSCTICFTTPHFCSKSPQQTFETYQQLLRRPANRPSFLRRIPRRNERLTFIRRTHIHF